METILCGDALEQLRTLEPESVHTCVTSPPYYNLRDYGAAGQIGMEATPEAYIGKLVDVFREVRRVLRPDGTMWVNIGDSYATRSGAQPPTNTRNSYGHTAKHPPGGYKYKDLMGIPWLLAFALRADGWYLRQDIIWHKTNAMPESVRDRCTKSHEYIFLLSKSGRYYFDAAAIRDLDAFEAFRETLEGLRPLDLAQCAFTGREGDIFRNSDAFDGDHGGGWIWGGDGSYILYDLGGEYDQFEGVLSVRSSKTGISGSFEVYCDGKLTFTSETVSGGGEDVEVSFRIAGCKELKIVFHCSYETSSLDNGNCLHGICTPAVMRDMI